MSMEHDIESIVERAIRNGLKEYHRDAEIQEVLIGIDLDFINSAGFRNNVGFVKVPALPRIGDKFEYHIDAYWDNSQWQTDREVSCVVTDIQFSNHSDSRTFIAEVAITEV